MIQNRDKIIEQVKALPPRPGVYIMRNAKGDVVYVGKAASLRSRVRSYFGSPSSLEPKTQRLSEHIADFEFIVTTTVQEALILEATLIKRHQPFFNVRLKDDKHYPYLKVDLNDPWPRVYIVRRVENDGARYFGPFASASSVRTTLDVVKKLFPWRSCTKIITGTDPRPCLDYFIHRCIAPCTGYCTKEEYDEVIRQVILFLEGHSDEVLDELQRKMDEASENLEFERAAFIRDQIQSVERVTERQVTATTTPMDADVFGMAKDGDEACVQVFFVRGIKMVGRDTFMLAGVQDEPDEQIVTSFLKQFYESATYVPRHIILPTNIEEPTLLRTWLSGKRAGAVEIAVPKRGERRRLVQIAAENAKEALQMARTKWLSDTTKKQEAMSQLQEELNLPTLPKRIECYDISNIQGTSSVGSMVVFVDGQPRPSEYRRFRIKSVRGANDFASMQEVLRRRFRRAGDSATDEGETWALHPDLLIVDGGKGQLSAAHDIMRDASVGHIPLAGLAKRNEELFLVDEPEPVVLPRTSQALYLVQRVRDEAHRFAITYHRNVRHKAGMQSALDNVPGVGPKRKKALLRKFGSVQRIREASSEDVAATPGFTSKLAQTVKEHL